MLPKETIHPGYVQTYRVVPIGRWWRLTESGAVRMVWGEFAEAKRQGKVATYTKAWFGYWVTLEEHWYDSLDGSQIYV